MPKAEEVATIKVNGVEFSDWETVTVETPFYTAARTCQFSVSEKLSGGTTFATLKIKPGDSCEVYLAGQKILTGIVFGRQVSLDEGAHAVVISARGRSGEIVDGSVGLKNNTQFRGYGLEQIARGLLQPFGINLKMVNVPSYGSKPFKDVSLWPGETVHSALDRLAKLRGMFVRDDEDGNLLIGTGGTNLSAAFVEGQNIKSITCTVRDDSEKSYIGVNGQQRADDQTPVETARKPAALVQGTSTRYRPLVLISEEPGDAEDMAHRADHENNWLLGKTIEVAIKVQGWLRPDGTLWNKEDTYTVTSPSCLLDSVELGPTGIIFGQDSQNGTTTTLTLTRPEARGRIGQQDSTKQNVSLPGGVLANATPISA